MATKIGPDVRARIIRDFQSSGKTKAQIARDYGISPTTVSRIIKASSPARSPGVSPSEPSGNTGSASGTSPGSGRTASREFDSFAQRYGITADKANRILEVIKAARAEIEEKSTEKGNDDRKTEDAIEYLVQEFLKWIESRDTLEKKLIEMGTTLDAAKNYHSEMEGRIDVLVSRAMNLEILIGKMKSEAESAAQAFSEMFDKISVIEEKLSEDRDTIAISSTLKWVLGKGPLDEDALEYLRKFPGLDKHMEEEMKTKFREILLRRIEGVLKDIRSTRSEKSASDPADSDSDETAFYNFIDPLFPIGSPGDEKKND